MNLHRLSDIYEPDGGKILYLVLDGIGGLPFDGPDRTALEYAQTPNLDQLAHESECGLHEPVGPGITPGSGPGHLGLFGYDPLKYNIGRGVLTALGIDFDLQPGDVAARGNFCTLDEDGVITDRRAGRISTEKCEELAGELDGIELQGATAFVKPVKEHRFLLVLRGDDLHGEIGDVDPHETGEKPHEPEAKASEAEKTAGLVAEFLERAREKLSDHHPANGTLLRGFACLPDWPRLPDLFPMRYASIAAYPMYRGVTRLLGMDILEVDDGPEPEFSLLEKKWDDYDYFYVHIKKIDSHGEDGDFSAKVALLEEVDRLLPRVRELNPDVLLVTGDHSTPAAMKAHSWHPVPVLIWSRNARPDTVASFGERACTAGGLGARFPATDLLPLALAHAGRLDKFGA